MKTAPLLALLVLEAALFVPAVHAAAPTALRPLREASSPLSTHRTKGAGVLVTPDVQRAPGGITRVTLRFSGVGPGEDARIRYTLEGPASFVSRDTTPLRAQEAGERVVQLRVGSGAPALLNVFTQQGGRTSVASVPLPGPDGDQKPQPPVPARADVPGGSPLVILPAQVR